MGIAFAIGWIVSRAILILLFYFVVTPIGIIARFFGKKFIDISFLRSSESVLGPKRELKKNKLRKNVLTEVHVAKAKIIAEYIEFLKENKKWWLMPIVFALLLFGLLIVITKGSALAPFIYTLF